MYNPFSKSGSARRATVRSRIGWLTGLLGTRDIEKRVIENLPSWKEFADQKLRDAQEKKGGERFELPPHRVDVSSPLQWNVLYLLVAGGALGLAFASPVWASYLIYGAIFGVFGLALLVTLRDALFFHMESGRLNVDGERINRRSEGEDAGAEGDTTVEVKAGLLGRKKRTVFRSRLLQIHYQNVLRTFEAGARRTWVFQDASIADIQTLLSQRGMKLAWTLIEVLPQLGLLGTLIGLTQMFQAFRVNADAPEVSILTGFATALGATLLANLFVLVLRPLHMRNERAMNEILSTLQMLMAMFILPTQQFVLERPSAAAGTAAPAGAPPPPPAGPSHGERRLSESLEQMSRMLAEFNELHRNMDSGALAQRSADIAQDVRNAVRSFREVFDPKHLEQQQRAFTQLSAAMRELAGKLHQAAEAPASAPEPAAGPATERIEHDLLQMRVLTRDTLVLLERISGQLGRLGAGERPALLSQEPRVRAMAFPDPLTDLDGGAGNGPPLAAAPDAARPLPGYDPGRPLAGYDPLAARPLRERR
jgi:biopolymer transport protein ExbB/TolQ